MSRADAFRADAFREVMAGVATPVSVVTVVRDGAPHGTTVSAFSSLSMSPPMLLVALDRRSDLLARLEPGQPFGVNVLGAHQAGLAAAFARKGADRFDGIEWTQDSGAPRLAGSPGWLACTVAQLVDGGDHVVVLGDVVRAASSAAPPLVYHARTFGTHRAA